MQASIEMTSKIVNVTAHIVAKNIADALADAPKYPYQIAFAIPYYQQLLMVRVLNGVRNRYIVIRQDIPTHKLDALAESLEEKRAIDSLIQESLVKILEENVSWTDQAQSPDTVPVIYPAGGQGR